MGKTRKIIGFFTRGRGRNRRVHPITASGWSPRFVGPVYFRAATIIPPKKPIEYPDVETIIEINKQVLRDIRVKKGDQHRVLSRSKIQEVIDKVISTPGDVYDKAATLIVELARAHPFASGNRRTAYMVTWFFLKNNGESPVMRYYDDIMKGIREGFYTREEIILWMKGNDLRPFKRFED